MAKAYENECEDSTDIIKSLEKLKKDQENVIEREKKCHWDLVKIEGKCNSANKSKEKY